MLYMVTFTINIPHMLAYIPAPWILWVMGGCYQPHDHRPTLFPQVMKSPASYKWQQEGYLGWSQGLSAGFIDYIYIYYFKWFYLFYPISITLNPIESHILSHKKSCYIPMNMRSSSHVFPPVLSPLFFPAAEAPGFPGPDLRWLCGALLQRAAGAATFSPRVSGHGNLGVQHALTML